MTSDTGMEGDRWADRPSERRAIVVVDVVESVRLMQADEAGVIHRWRRFVNEVRDRLLPALGGRLVKSLGDGLRLEFESVPAAVAAAQDLHQRVSAYNTGHAAVTSLQLRASVHVCEVVIDDLDYHGAGVNLAARLATLAGPGETIVSSEVRDLLVPGVDPDTEDLGECYLKHYDAPVRAFRIGHAQPMAVEESMRRALDLHVGVAVLPFQPRFVEPAQRPAGDLIADQVVAGLSRTQYLRVISRLSTVAIAERGLPVQQIGAAVGAPYVLSGSFDCRDDVVIAHAELADAAGALVLWSERIEARLGDLLAGQDEIVPRLVAAVSRTIMARELTRSSVLPLPTLQSHNLLMSGIGSLHRSTARDFDRARSYLEVLADRHARTPHGNAWLGKWYVLRAVQGLSTDPVEDARRALDRAHRALDCDPNSALALTMSGHVHGFLLKDLKTAGLHLDAALAENPNEALAWLYRSVLKAWQGQGEAAWREAQTALSLSPLDPMRYYFESIAAFAAMTCGRHEQAKSLCQSSLKGNRVHGPTYRTLAIAQWHLNEPDAARHTMQTLLAIDPGFTLERYRAQFPGGDTAEARHNADVMAECGAPQ